MRVAGIILAAGASSRMGRPKALLELDGVTFVDRLIDRLGGVSDEVIVVLGYHAGAIRAGARLGERAVFTINPDPARGQLSSLQSGLGAMAAGTDGALFAPVDLPSVEPETVKTVAHRLAQGVALVIPRCRGRRGHPVGVSRTLIDELLSLPETARASDVIHGHLSEAAFVDVDDPGAVDDVDDEEAYRRLLARSPAR